jgi:hypothetical protein
MGGTATNQFIDSGVTEKHQKQAGGDPTFDATLLIQQGH